VTVTFNGTPRSRSGRASRAVNRATRRQGNGYAVNGAVWYLMLCSWSTACCSSDLYATTTVTSDGLPKNPCQNRNLLQCFARGWRVATAFIAYFVFLEARSIRRIEWAFNAVGKWQEFNRFLSPVRPKRQSAIPHVLQYSVDRFLPHTQAHRPSPRDRNDEVRIEKVLVA
jgi:hypothetical protein